MAPKPSVADAYSVLGLEEGASLETVKSTYKQLALRTHPDKNPDNADATAQFQRLSEAYKVLLRNLDRPTPRESSFGPFSQFQDYDGGYEEEDLYSDDSDDNDLDFYLFMFSELLGGRARYASRRAYRRDMPETPEQYQARVKRNREEQIAAQERRDKENAARKLQQEKEREKERLEAERRQRAKLSDKKAKADAMRKNAEKAARKQQQRSQTLRSSVFSAARSGDAAKVKKGVWEDEVDAAGGEVKIGCEAFVQRPPDDPRETLLHIAAERGDTELVQWLDAHSADPEEQNSEGLTAFHIALRNGHIAIARHFLDSYPPKEQESKHIYHTRGSKSLLSLALDSNEPETVWLILDKGLSTTQDTHKAWARVASSDEPQLKKSAVNAEKLGEIRNLLMTFGGFTPPPTPKVGSRNGRDPAAVGCSTNGVKRSETPSPTPPTLAQPNPVQKKPQRHPAPSAAPEQLPAQTTPVTVNGAVKHQQPVNHNRGRGQGRGRGRGRGKGSP